MKTSEALDKIAPALAKAQAAIKPATKDSTNPHFKSKYADLTAVWDALHLALGDNGLALIQLPVHADDQRVHLCTRLQHNSGQWIEETASIPIAKYDPHGYGSGLTYLRRYCAAAIMFLATEDDDANTAATKANGAAKDGGARQTAVDELSALPEEDQKYAQQAAIRIMATAERGEDPVPVYLKAKDGLDHEHVLAIWSMLPSAIRAAIKKRGQEAQELATQP